MRTGSALARFLPLIAAVAFAAWSITYVEAAPGLRR